MNATHIHLLLNHFPIIGTMIAAIVLTIGLIKKNNLVIRISAFLIAGIAIITIPVFLTGEPAEESVEKLPGVSNLMIEQHEDFAQIALWLMELSGAISLVYLFINFKNNVLNVFSKYALFLFVILTIIMMSATGYYGGQIRHSELNSGNTSAPSSERKTSGESDDD